MGPSRCPGPLSNCRRCLRQDEPRRRVCRRSRPLRSPTSSFRSMPFGVRRPVAPSRWRSICGSMSSGRRRRRDRVRAVGWVCGAAWRADRERRRCPPPMPVAARVEPLRNPTQGRLTTCSAVASSGSSIASGFRNPVATTTMAWAGVGEDRGRVAARLFPPPRRGKRMPPFRYPATSAPFRRRSGFRPARSSRNCSRLACQPCRVWRRCSIATRWSCWPPNSACNLTSRLPRISRRNSWPASTRPTRIPR